VKVAEMFALLVGPESKVGLRAYDGSEFGPVDPTATIVMNSPEALQYVVTAPSDLGLARAYITGSLDVEGDLHAAIVELAKVDLGRLSLAEKAALLQSVGIKNIRRPAIPPQEVRMRGRRHSKRRDADAISHHYDVSNEFYSQLLGPSMAYTCAVFPTPEATLEEAQAYKFDLVARKLGLEPGMRLLDVGCGWGGMVVHAAREYGVHVIGVTLSRQQAEYGAKLVAELGLGDRAEVRHGDYRDVPESGFDRVSSIGLTEHIGLGNYPSYFGFLLDKLAPEGRLLNHTITRNDGTQRARAGGFISRYIFPDGELAGPAQVMGAMNDAGFEIQHSENFRPHYALTLKHWGENLAADWDAAVAEVGVQKARTWRLYLAASQAGFDLNRIQLHQFLGTKTLADGASGYPWRHEF
jgi:cyclopropane-fatty-acyl-phospholipid synthase